MSVETIDEYMVYAYYIKEICGAPLIVDRIKFTNIKDANEFIDKLYNNNEIEMYELQQITTYIKKSEKSKKVEKNTHKNILKRVCINQSPWVTEWRKTVRDKQYS